MERYIGLMSGTSADGIDAALVEFNNDKMKLVKNGFTPYPAELRKKVLELYQSNPNEIQRFGELDIELGQAFAQAALNLLKQNAMPLNSITAIGSHGQTIRHHPHKPYAFTLQIGDPNTIAALTGITTIADFRRKDMAFGGQGAPLVPAFHHYLLSNPNKSRVVINIGGIANVTILPHHKHGQVIGFDTGPGNALADAWIYKHLHKNFDAKGEWASQGKVNQGLLKLFLTDDYFKISPPKSTGREYFHLAWLNSYLTRYSQTITPIDVQATLIELTASSILQGIQAFVKNGELIICGGGVHNAYLMARLTELAKPNYTVQSIANFGIDPDVVEAMAFAWLARQTYLRQPGNLPSVTGAKQLCTLGGVYFPN